MPDFVWTNSIDLPSHNYTCGYCGHNLASGKGYHGHERVNSNSKVYVYVCHYCTNPTFVDRSRNQHPGAKYGQPIKFIPDENVEKLYNEARSCYTINAYTSVVMCCRKLLMNIAVKEGAKEKDTFINYVNHLNDNGFIPPRGKAWIDAIRKLGNEATHSIEFKTADDARLVLTFTEMLLRFIYEMPGLMEEANPSAKTATGTQANN